MLCSIDMSAESQLPLSHDELVAITDLVLSQEGVSRHCLVSVSVVSNDRMQELNRQWRGQDRPTDVLSLECERPDDPDLGEGEPCELGDVVLAPDYIRNQALRLGTTFADECRLLYVHAILHMLGYDHVAEEEAVVMEAREDELLALLDTDAHMEPVRLTRHDEEHPA